MPARVDPLTGAGTLAPLELASGVVFGRDARGPSFARRPPGPPLAALEAALMPALRRAPCVVSFSGGRDSSALLAVATRVARRECLPEPIPVTLRFPQAARTDEHEWQEEVIRRLGCSDWARLEFTDELDLIGPTARRVMSWLGLPYPYNLHLLLPLMEPGRGGSFVTGMGGDQSLFAAGRALDVLARRTRPVPRDGLRIAAAAAPRAVKRSALRGRVGLHFPWLSPSGNAALARGWLDEEVRKPLRWNARLREMWRSRFMQLSLERIASLGRHVDVEPVHPFVDAGFLSALAATAGSTGFPNRSAAMRALFAQDLPERVVTRGTKASFNEVLWNRHTQRFVAGLTPDRLEPALRTLAVARVVDPQALANHWSQPEPMANSFLLLQACWLAQQASPVAR
jgi:asparagine synthetase B (glutamine-hydrolysing)